MKALIVFSESSSVSFYSVDGEFQHYLQHRIQLVGAMPDPQPGESHSVLGDDLREALALFFLPLLASYDVLNSLKKPLISVTADDDFIFVFRKFRTHVFVAVNGDGTENEEVLMRRLHVFGRIVGILYGPVIQKMSPVNLQHRAVQWQRLNSILNSYETLYNTEQAFLMEAVEHIRFGQLNTAQNACVALAEECLSSNHNGGITSMKHALLIVGSKILASCGRSPQLPTADTLLLILLTTNIYYHQSNKTTVSEMETMNDTKGENDDHTEQNLSRNDDEFSPVGDVDQLFGTPYQTPTSTSPGEISETNRDKEPMTASLPIPQPPVDNDDLPPFKTPNDDETEGMVAKSFGGRLRHMLGGLGRKGMGNERQSDHDVLHVPDDSTAPMAKYHEQKVFLQLNPNQYIPHTLHCLEVYPQITLVLISEPQSSNLAGVICQTLTNLRQTITTKSNAVSGRSMFDILDDSMKRIVDGAKSEAKALNSESLKKSVVKVFSTWGRLRDAHFLKYLEKNLTEQLDITRVVNQAEYLIESLISLYDELYFSPKVLDYDKQTVVSRLLKLSSKLSRDYGEYLSMKATINLPFPGFGSNFPGMVHFAFVDRSFDELTSPSLVDELSSSSYLEERAKCSGEVPGVFLKRKVWDMVKRSQRYLTNGYTSQTWMDDDFLYTYCMWISMLNPNLGTFLRMAAPSSVRAVEDEPPGVLCGNFYKDIMGGSDGNTPGYINELYCIHESHVPLDVATSQCKNLAIQLWMNTKQALAPFPLIN